MPLLAWALLALGAYVLFRPNIAWADGMRAAIARTLPDLSAEGQKLILAQAALESGFGSTIAARANNPFNIVAMGWSGPYVIAPDALPGDPGRTQKFRQYDSADAGVADYWRVIGLSRYGRAQEYAQAGNVSGFVAALRTGGYFETPYETYLAGVSDALGRL